MNRPLVSIITPTYKHERYIAECIESVLDQTYDNWEQIIVDDYSPDRTWEIARSYKDARIKVVQKPVRGGADGLHESYNLALNMARGELIAVLEGDDYWPADKLEIQIPLHQQHEAIMSWGGYQRLVENNKLRRMPRHSSKPKFFPNSSYLLIRNVIPALTVVASREALLSVGGFWQPEGTVFVDHPTWLRLSRLGNILYIPKTLGIYRLHESQISRKQKSKISLLSHDYTDKFLSDLTTEERATIDVRRVHAARDLYDAQLNQEARKRGAFMRLIIRALWGGDYRTRYECLRLIVYLLLKRNVDVKG